MIRTFLFTAMLSTGLQQAADAQKVSKGTQREELRFLEDIEAGIGPEQGLSVKVASTPLPQYRFEEKRSQTKITEGGTIESVTALQLKYAIILDTEVETLQNLPLFQTIEEWWGTRYRLGGQDKSGIDCSAFTHVLYDSLYKINLPRTSRDQFQVLAAVAPQEMKEGDLVFFGSGSSISHVGFYLQNNKFVHASTSEGVTISDLNEPYWSRRFVGVGRYDIPALISTKP